MKKELLIALIFCLSGLPGFAQQPCNTFECAFQKAEQILKTSTAKDKYAKVLANLDDAENFAGSDMVKREKIKGLRKRAFEAIQREKERADDFADKANKLAAANRQQVLTNYANDLAYKSTSALERGDRTTAFQLAVLGNRYVEPNNPNLTQALAKALYCNDVPGQAPLFWYTRLEGHVQEITSLAFSPDGKSLATGSKDKTVKIWDLDTGRPGLTLAEQEDEVISISFSADGKWLAVGLEDQSVKIWDTQSGKIKFNLAIPDVRSIAFSPDGTLLAISTYAEDAVQLWSMATGAPAFKLEGHTEIVNSVAFSPDGQWLAAGSSDSTAKVWSLQSKELRLTLKGHQGAIASLAFSPDGKQLATGSNDGSAKTWDLDSGNPVLNFGEHPESVTSVAFSPDGKYLAIGADRMVSIRNLDTGLPLLQSNDFYYFGTHIAFASDGKRMASTYADNSVRIWELNHEQQALSLEGNRYNTSIAFSPDGKYLAAATSDTLVNIWNLESGTPERRLTGHQDKINSVAFSPNGKWLATGASDATAKIWDLESGRAILSLVGHQAEINSVAFSPNGKWLATGSKDNSAKIWDVHSGKLLHSLEQHDRSVSSVRFSPDGKLLATGSRDKTVKIWAPHSGDLIKRFTKQESVINTLAFSPDGKYMATGAGNLASLGAEYPKLWVLESGKQVQAFGEEEPVLIVNSIAFSPDGKSLAAGTSPGSIKAFSSNLNSIKVWDVESGQPTLSLLGYTNEIICVAFSPDGKRLAAIANDNPIKIWEISVERMIEKASKSKRLSAVNSVQLIGYNLETLLDLHPDNEAKLIATREVWQIKAFADLAAAQAGGSNVLSRVEAPYSRANRLYAAALALQDELLIKMDWAKMLRKWAAVYRDDGKEGKAKELEGKADGLWKEEK